MMQRLVLFFIVLIGALVLGHDTEKDKLKNDNLVKAIDAAFMSVISKGEFRSILEKWKYVDRFTLSWNCNPDASKWTYPAFSSLKEDDRLRVVLTNKVLRIGSTDANWGDQSGRYDLPVPTGFWPDMLEYAVREMGSHYNVDVKIKRVVFTGATWSADILNSLKKGEEETTAKQIDVSEPFFMQSAFTEGVPRKYAYKHSCITVGQQSRVITVKASGIASMEDLNKVLETNQPPDSQSPCSKTGKCRVIAVLSPGNFSAVRAVLNKNATAKVFKHTADIIAALAAGEAVAGILTSPPTQGPGATPLNIFFVPLISVQSYLYRRDHGYCVKNTAKTLHSSNNLRLAIDAAFLRTIDSQVFLRVSDKHGMSDYLQSSWTCNPSNVKESYPFPLTENFTKKDRLDDILKRGVIRVGGTKADWGTAGNYTQVSPTGYWPDMLAAVIGEVSTAYSTTIRVEYVWFDGTNWAEDLLSALNLPTTDAKAVDMSDLYFLTSAFYNDKPRSQEFEFSCTIAGQVSNFVTLKTSLVDNVDKLNTVFETNGGKGSLPTSAPCIAKDRCRKVGVLSHANYDVVKPVLKSSTAVVFGRSGDLMAAVRSGDVMVGLLTHKVEGNKKDVIVFSSTIVTPRAAMFRKDTHYCGVQGGNGTTFAVSILSVLLLFVGLDIM
eukprot:Platyproteum_vivax@DN4839_c0_g1_i1.p1